MANIGHVRTGVSDVTPQIALLIRMFNERDSEVMYAETEFLYATLALKIYTKIPPGIVRGAQGRIIYVYLWPSTGCTLSVQRIYQDRFGVCG